VLTLQVDSPGPAGQGWSIWVDPRLTPSTVKSDPKKPPRRSDLQPRAVMAVASGSNDNTIFINGQKLMDCRREKASTAAAVLKPGDVIAVRLGDRFDIQSHWMAFLSDKGEVLLETSDAWKGYVPAARETWWDTSSKDLKHEPAQYCPDGREYVDQVKAAAARALPKHPAVRPIYSPLGDGFLAYVVTVEDLAPKKGEDDATDSPVVKGKKPNPKALYKSVVGVYSDHFDGNKIYPMVNLTAPNRNLWLDSYAVKRANVNAGQLKYVGKARFTAPADGDYVLKAANISATIDGVKIDGFRDEYTRQFPLKKGMHTIQLDTTSYGQPFLQSAWVQILDPTGKEVPLVNTWADLEQVLRTNVGGQPVVELSDWEPSEENLVPVKPK
jgi:hypothetical protein